MECKCCKGSGEVCDSCGEGLSCWVNCECGGSFCSVPAPHLIPTQVLASCKPTCWDQHKTATGHNAEIDF